MKQLMGTQAWPVTFAVRAVPTSAVACAEARLGGRSGRTRPSAVEQMTYTTSSGFHVATGLMVIPTNDADRRPPETPT